MPASAPPIEIGGHRFEWGTRTYVMGIVNVTPDSFSGDGVLDPPAPPTRPPAWSLRAPTSSTSARSRRDPATRR